MERPEVRFARAADGAYLAYQVLGEGPTVLFWQEDSFALVDELWESPQELAWHEGLAAFARLIIYDRRGIGLSSRNVAPGSLEVQVQDTLSVLDAEGIERACFGGFLESCAPNVLLAATRPDRVQALVWAMPVPRSGPEPDYPWGVDATYVAAERALLDRWGTEGWARDYVALNAEVLGGAWSTESYIRFLARVSRRTCTPDVAMELAQIWLETDVRDVLPAVQAPMLTIDFDEESVRELAAYISARVPRSEHYYLPGDTMEVEHFGPIHDAIRRFVGAERAPVGLDSVLATVLFTDIVGSTERAASVGDVRWKELLADHDRRARAELERFHGVYVDSTGDGLLARFDGPARRPLRPQHRGGGPAARHGDPRGVSHGRDRAGRRSDPRSRRAHRGTRGGDGRRGRGLDHIHREGPDGGLGPHVRGRRRARSERGARPLAPVSGRELGDEEGSRPTPRGYPGVARTPRGSDAGHLDRSGPGSVRTPGLGRGLHRVPRRGSHDHDRR
jgi:hypothetical protein